MAQLHCEIELSSHHHSLPGPAPLLERSNESKQTDMTGSTSKVTTGWQSVEQRKKCLSQEHRSLRKVPTHSKNRTQRCRRKRTCSVQFVSIFLKCKSIERRRPDTRVHRSVAHPSTSTTANQHCRTPLMLDSQTTAHCSIAHPSTQHFKRIRRPPKSYSRPRRTSTAETPH